MHNATSKELYMMNGGQKLYIYKDGFGDVYKASAAEEAEWAAEIIANALMKIEKETNRTSLQTALDNLIYHKYERLEQVLLENIHDADPGRQIVFATALWKMVAHRDQPSFRSVIEELKKILNVT